MQKGGGMAPNVGVLGRRPDGYTGDGADRIWLCGPTDLVSACRLIGVCEILATCLAFVLLILFYCVFYSETYAYQLICGAWSLGIGIVFCGMALVFVVLLFGALKTENGPMMLVHAGVQIFASILMGFAAIVGIVLVIGWSEQFWGPEVYLRPSQEGRVQDQYAAQKTAAIIGGIVALLSLIGLLVNGYFTLVVLKTYRLFSGRQPAPLEHGHHIRTVY